MPAPIEPRPGPQPAARDVLPILFGARTLIESPRSWTRRAMARTPHGRPVEFSSPKAARFCLAGALLRCAYDLSSPEPTAAAVGMGAATLAFALVGVGGVHQPKALRRTALPDEVLQVLRDHPEGAIWDVAVTVLQRGEREFGSSALFERLAVFVIDLNDAPPASRRRALEPLDRALRAAHAAAEADL